jgi:hypothetical protein
MFRPTGGEQSEPGWWLALHSGIFPDGAYGVCHSGFVGRRRVGAGAAGQAGNYLVQERGLFRLQLVLEQGGPMVAGSLKAGAPC